jgi:hypothetical protein
VSFIQPMFHLWLKPRPPYSMGWVTFGQAVLSSAITIAGCFLADQGVGLRRKSIASRFSRPPKRLGTHWPASRE